MTLTMNSLSFDAADPKRLGSFWAAALDYETRIADDDFVMLQDTTGIRPVMMFQLVPEAKTAKNRMHIDLAADNMEAEITRLEEMGARRGELHRTEHVTWTVMYDPEGNEFCVADHP